MFRAEPINMNLFSTYMYLKLGVSVNFVELAKKVIFRLRSGCAM